MSIAVAEIQTITATFFRLDIADMKSAERSRIVARPRQIAMYLSRKLTRRSTTEIGRLFGMRDHTTVIHGVRAVEKLIAENPRIRSSVIDLEHCLRNRASRRASDIEAQKIMAEFVCFIARRVAEARAQQSRR